MRFLKKWWIKLIFEKILFVEEVKWFFLDKDNNEMYRKCYGNLWYVFFVFRGWIFNGYKVFYFCNFMFDKWVVVGYMFFGGRGLRNLFGDDFVVNGNVSNLYIYFWIF